jgi:hypothetical protein
MKDFITASMGLLIAMFFSGTALAEDLTLTYTVPEVSIMTTNAGDGITFTFVEPAAGEIFTAVTDTFTVSVTDNTGTPMKVVIGIDPASTPPDCENGPYLSIAASAGIGTPEPEFWFEGVDHDLITGIQSESGSSTVTLRLQADMTTCVMTNGTATLVVTYCADS